VNFALDEPNRKCNASTSRETISQNHRRSPP
jgi:hypothetical protein